MPFKFFEELHKEHERILKTLEKKIVDTESLAKQVFSRDSASPASQAADQKSLKVKIFEVCKMIYQQQKAVSAQLFHVDQRVRQLKNETSLLIQRKNPDLAREDVDKIFNRYSNAVVDQTLKTAQDKQSGAKLASVLGQKLAIGIKQRAEREEELKKKLTIAQELCGADDEWGAIGTKRRAPVGLYSEETPEPTMLRK